MFIQCLTEVEGNGSNLIEYAATENRLRIYLGDNSSAPNADLTNYEQGRSITLAGDDSFRSDLNGRSYVISSTRLLTLTVTCTLTSVLRTCSRG